MKYVFFILVFSLFFGMLAYVMLRGWQVLPTSIRMLYIELLSGLIVLLLTGLFFDSALPSVLSKIITFTGYTFLMVAFYLFLSFLLVDIIRLANHILHFAPAGMHSFRLGAMSFSLILIAITLVIGNYHFNHPKIVKLDLTVDRPLQNKELKIIAASDFHLGNAIDSKMLKKYVKLINAQHPDIVLLLGDMTDRSAKPLFKQNMKAELQSIRAPLGVFAIRGNHEYYSGKPQEISAYLKASGITVLIDSACLVNNSFYIIGRDDKTNLNRKTLPHIIEGLNKNLPKILLDHQPFHLEVAEQNGIDLQLSGHTHNGQFFPFNLYVKSLFEVGYGYLKKGKTNYYVSSGLGLWGPQYRIGTQSEIVEIILKY